MSRTGGAVQRQPGSVAANSDLIRDYHQTLVPPLREDLAGVFEVVQSGGEGSGRSELVTVGPNQELKHYYPDPSSHSGWNVESVEVPGAPVDARIEKLLAFYQDDLLYVLVLYATSSGDQEVVGLFSPAPGSWGPLPFDPQLAGPLAAMQQTDVYRDADGRYFIYGIAAAAFNVPTLLLVSEDPTSKQWVVVFEEAVTESSVSSVSFRVLDGYAGNQMTLVRFQGSEATFQGGSIENGVFRPSGAASGYDLGQGALTSQQVFSVASPNHEQGFLLLTAGQELFLVTGYDIGKPEVTALGGQTNGPDRFPAVALGVDLEGHYVVFANDGANALWLARQAVSSAAGAVAFQPWVPLGNVVGTVGCPASMSNGPEAFLVGLNADLTHLAQALTDGIWKTVTLATPSPSAQAPVTRRTYSREFVVRDRQGNLLQNVPVQVLADRKAVVTVNGLTHHVDTVSTAATTSNLQGRVIVSSEAVSLSSLGLTLEVGGEGGLVQGPFRADLRTHQRLSGQDDTFVVSGQTLQQSGIVPSSVSPAQADAYAAQVRQLASLAVKQHRAGEPRSVAGGGPATGLALDFSGAHAAYRELSEEEAKRAWESAADGGSIWGDVAHFFEQEIDQLVSLTIQVLDDAARVIINGVKYLLTTLADVLKAIEVFLVKLAEDVVDAIEKILDWLRMLFDWDDVLDTQKVVAYYLTQALGNLETDVGQEVPQQLVRGFDTVRDRIEQAFDAAEKYFSNNGQTLSQTVPSQWSNPIGGSGPPLAGDGVRTAHDANAVRCNYVRNKVGTFLATAGGAALFVQAPPFDLDRILETFEQQFPAQKLEQALGRVLDLQKSLSDPKSFPDVAVVDLLQAVEDMVVLVLAGIEAQLLAMLELASEALVTFGEALDAPLDVPVLSWLYKELTGETLTVASAATLLIALPVTILYKILFGGSELTPPFSQQDVATITSQPIPWPKAGGSQRTPVRAAAAAGASDLDVTLAVTFCIGFVVYAFEDVWLDGVTAMSYDDADILDEFKTAITFFSWTAIVTSTVLQAVGVPYQAIEGQDPPSDDWVIATWATAWSPILADLLATCAQGTLMRMVPRFGPACGSVLGGLGLAVAIPTAALMRSPPYNSWNEAELVLPTLPYLFQPIVIAGWDGIPNAVAQLFLAFVDLFGDVGTGICKVAGMSPSAAAGGAR